MKVLIPLDGSAFSRQVLPHVCRLLEPVDHVLVLLHVATIPENYAASPPRPIVSNDWPVLSYDAAWEAERAMHPVSAVQLWEGFKTSLLGDMASEVRCLRDAGFIVSVMVRFGDPAQEITDLVEEEDIDLIAMATHGRTGLGRLVMGSVAEKVLHSVRVPVLMVRPMKELAAEPLPVILAAET